MADLMLRRTATGFVPADTDAEDACRKLGIGHIFRAKVQKPRSIQHHRLAFALLSLTWKNLPEQFDGRWASFDHFRKAVALEAGHCEEILTSQGEVVRIPSSLAFDALDQVAFSPVFTSMMTVCAGILRISAPELEAEVAIYADAHYGREAA